MKRNSRIIIFIFLLTIIVTTLTGCKEYYRAKPGECIWCDGVGWYMAYGSDGRQNVRKTCPHCHGTGRSN